jgi:hypothetical protein
MHEALTALLLAHAPLTDLIGDRLHWLELPRGVGGDPYVILQEIGGSEDYHSTGPSGLHGTRVQVDSWGTTFDSAVAVQRVISALLSGYRGTVADTDLQGIFSDGVRDLPGRTLKDEARLYRRSQDFFIHWRKD